eukprot:CAMPEP_0177609848 /NCGR_PEP_ID=MMETSP0419_2-20121207/19374_1 /TAXON_ID=582737 /ORGANISM="Tetraselmis sp., Strain GSL018" /LENGTH=453 /DNA_ID=CAMNT_0019104933 /DNA_START=46 /DNA_END=1407 /DNA_ORIENTATION=+
MTDRRLELALWGYGSLNGEPRVHSEGVERCHGAVHEQLCAHLPNHKKLNASFSTGDGAVESEWNTSPRPPSCLTLQQALARSKFQQSVDQFQLVGPAHGCDHVHDIRDRRLGSPDDVVIPQVGEHRHEDLAVHPVRHPSMPGDAAPKVLNLKGTLEAAGKETAKWADEGREDRQEASVDLDRLRRDLHRHHGADEPLRGPRLAREVRKMLDDHVRDPRVKVTEREDAWLVKRVIRAAEVPDGQVRPWARQPLEPPHDGGEEYGRRHGPDEPSNKALPCLLRRELDKRRPAKEESCEVCRDVVGEYEGAGQQQPDDALEDVGHEEGGGHEDREEDHVRPGVLPELVEVHPLPQAQDEHDEPGDVEGEGDQVVLPEEAAEDLHEPPVRGDFRPEILPHEPPVHVHRRDEEEVPLLRPEAGERLLLLGDARHLEELPDHDKLGSTEEKRGWGWGKG